MKISPATRRFLTKLLIGGIVLQLAAAVWMLGDLVLRSSHTGTRSAERSGAARKPLGRASADCRVCHEEIYRLWAGSDHAHAHRTVDKALDADAFAASRKFTISGVGYRIGWANGKPSFIEQRPGAAPEKHAADFVLGHAPLRQYIIPVGHGRYQAFDLAFDPAKKEWFNVFGNEQRQPGEWGHWQGRGMNWNSRCALCHLTEFAKNYDRTDDTYRSTWLEHGVGCVQCHGDLSPDHASPGYKTSARLQQQTVDRAHNQETCVPCHARNELLTGEPRPGMRYDDHFRLALPLDPAVFYPDGQVRDEDFNGTSLLTSRMGGKAGITCLDCHEPHAGKPRLPVANNVLCMQCHAGAKGAPVIDPTAHSHHQPGSTGNQCVACHMPTTPYMQRDPRHDHGFLKPDPLLTRELGIPNACDRCHADRGIDWEIDANEKWYGAKLDSRQRQRARAVDAAQKGTAGAAAGLLGLMATEEVPAWKATLLQLARPWAEEPAVTSAAIVALSDRSALVRSAAVQILSSDESVKPRLREALRDSSRLVRVDAEWALSAELASGSPARKELDAYLALSADQPVGRMQIGQDLANQGKLAEAEAAMRKAITWDPYSAGLSETLGLLLNQADRKPEAATELWRAAQIDRANAHLALDAALAFADAAKLTDAEAALRESVRRDPTLHRGWYNLGLLLAQTQRAQEGIAALERAEALAPGIADYPYARATILWAVGDRKAARAAAARALEIDPSHANARQILSP